MQKTRLFRLLSIFGVLLLLSTGIQLRTANALISQRTLNWFWTDNTTVSSVAVGDLYGDGKTEIVAGGAFDDNATGWYAYVSIINSSTLTPVNGLTWRWINNTMVSSVCVGEVDTDNKSEVIAGGSFYDSLRWNAFVAIFNGTTMAPIASLGWYWTNDTQVSSVSVGDVNGDGKGEVVAGGSFFDNNRTNTFVAVLNGTNLSPLSTMGWFWTNRTFVSSVAVADVNNDSRSEVLSAGSFFDNTRQNAFVAVLNGSNLAPLNTMGWYWVNDTVINSIAAGDINSDNRTEIVAGGTYFDNTRTNAFMIALNGSSLVSLYGLGWFWTSDTYVKSIAIGNFTGTKYLDVISCGSYSDGVRSNGHLEYFNGTNLSVLSSTNWFLTSATSANSVALGNFGVGNRFVTGGAYFDLTRDNAQIITWG